jgi:transcriptional regulator with XRE-family HTH domain
LLNKDKGTLFSFQNLKGTLFSLFIHIMLIEAKYNIKEIRESRGLNQQQFADSIGITREMVGHIERGKKNISKATEILIKEFLNNEKKVPFEVKSESDITLSTISDLAKSSVVLAEANKVLAEANKTLANNNEVLVNVLRANSNGFSKTIVTDKEGLIDNFLKQGLGTLWSSADEGRTVLGKYLYEFQVGKQE